MLTALPLINVWKGQSLILAIFAFLVHELGFKFLKKERKNLTNALGKAFMLVMKVQISVVFITLVQERYMSPVMWLLMRKICLTGRHFNLKSWLMTSGAKVMMTFLQLWMTTTAMLLQISSFLYPLLLPLFQNKGEKTLNKISQKKKIHLQMTTSQSLTAFYWGDQHKYLSKPPFILEKFVITQAESTTLILIFLALTF